MTQLKRTGKPRASTHPTPRHKPGAREAYSSGDVYRLCRMLHGYLSAFAFLALIFFSVTGLTLNHPGWLAGGRAAEQLRMIQVPKGEMDAALRAPDPGRALGAVVGRLTPLKGRYQSGEIEGGEALLRFEGPSGVSDVVVQTATGRAEIGVKQASAIALLNDLHKGKAAGKAWSWVIDVSAIVFILLSVLGYVLFFSLRFRLKLSLVLTALSLVLMLGIFWVFVA